MKVSRSGLWPCVRQVLGLEPLKVLIFFPYRRHGPEFFVRLIIISYIVGSHVFHAGSLH